jgi:alcohol dehydrogenase class IV
LATSRKKLIIDDAVVPPRALFDYATTRTMSGDFTADGAFDGISHCLEVLLGSRGDTLTRAWPVTTLGIDLIVSHIEKARDRPDDLAAREAIGLGTDLGGYAIMIGGTNGAHLTSFSLVDLLPHGRACAILNPYYTVLFAPAVEPQLRDVARVLREAGYLPEDTSGHAPRALALAVAGAMHALCRRIGFPTTLGEIDGFSDAHIERALDAARNPQLASKLQNMPIPLTADRVDEVMRPVLQAAATGNFELIPRLRTGEADSRPDA